MSQSRDIHFLKKIKIQIIFLLKAPSESVYLKNYEMDISVNTEPYTIDLISTIYAALTNYSKLVVHAFAWDKVFNETIKIFALSLGAVLTGKVVNPGDFASSGQYH